ncbi:MAG: phosphotransferase enzyme family protein [Pseudomonadales bacterium]
MTDFFELDLDAQAERMEQLARKTLPAWGLDGADLQLIKYRENAVFKLVKPDGTPYALRVHRGGYHSDAALRSELQWMAALDEAGIHVPKLVAALDGESFIVGSIEGVPGPHQIDLFEWVEGSQLGSVEEGISDPEAIAETYHTIGSLAARLHNQATAWTPPEGFVRHAWDAEGLVGKEPFWGPFWELELLTDEQAALMISARDRVYADLEAYASMPGNEQRYSMIHADFVVENLMVEGDGVRLIDFDDAGFGWHLFELATAVYFEMEQDYYLAAWNALVEGYRLHRELPDSQLQFMPLFLLARGFTYLGWVHTRSETETAKELAPVLIEKACGLARSYLTGENIP